LHHYLAHHVDTFALPCTGSFLIMVPLPLAIKADAHSRLLQVALCSRALGL